MHGCALFYRLVFCIRKPLHCHCHYSLDHLDPSRNKRLWIQRVVCDVWTGFGQELQIFCNLQPADKHVINFMVNGTMFLTVCGQ